MLCEKTIPYLIKKEGANASSLAILGSENLKKALAEWSDELDSLMKQLGRDAGRKDRRTKPEFAGLAQHAVMVYDTIKVIDDALKMSCWKPLLSVERGVDHFTENSLVYVIDELARDPRFVPALVYDCSGFILTVKLCDSSDHGFRLDLRGCDIFAPKEIAYLIDNADYLEFFLNNCCDDPLDRGMIRAMILEARSRVPKYDASS